MNHFEEMPAAEKKENFRDIVGALVDASELFPILSMSKEQIGKEEMTIVDAIENKEVAFYLKEAGLDSDERAIDTVNCLMTIHDELESPKPDHDFIAQNVGILKDLLS